MYVDMLLLRKALSCSIADMRYPLQLRLLQEPKRLAECAGAASIVVDGAVADNI